MTNEFKPFIQQEALAELDVQNGAMAKMVAMLCSEIESGTPENQELQTVIGQTFSDNCLEEMVNQAEAPKMRM